MVIKRIRQILPGYTRPPTTRPRPPLPPVPRSLRSALKNHPDHIERLQMALHGVNVAPTTRLPRIEMAVWAIEDRLSRFLAEAKQELDSARCSGDAERFARAEEDEALMTHLCRKNTWMGDEVFAAWFRSL